MTETLRIASTPDAPPEAVAFAESICGRIGLDEELIGRIALAAAEAAANAAEHGNRFQEGREVVVAVTWDAASLELSVEDEGPGVAADALATASLPADPMDTGGRGLFLIHELADEATLEAGGRRVVMRWRLH